MSTKMRWMTLLSSNYKMKVYAINVEWMIFDKLNMKNFSDIAPEKQEFGTTF